MNKLAIYLNKHIDGVVYGTPEILVAYATDRSLLEYTPRLVAVPEHVLDLRRLLRFSSQLARKNVCFPVSVRGAGLDRSGADLGSGMVIDTKKLNRIQEIDAEQRLIRVQTGATLGEVRAALCLQGLELSIYGDASETIGDLVARNASACFNLAPATMADLVQSAECVLADGTLLELGESGLLRFKRLLQQKGKKGEFLRKLWQFYREHAEKIQKIDALHRRSGYAGLKNLKKCQKINPAGLLCGAQNGLAVVSEVILRTELKYSDPERLAVVCRNAKEYLIASIALKKFGFTDLFLYDTELFDELENTGKTSRFFRKVSSDGYLIVATLKDDSRCRRRQKLRSLEKKLDGKLRIIHEDKDNAPDFSALASNLTAYLNDTPKNRVHLPIVDGVYIPPRHQVEFLERVTALAQDFKLKLAVFGRPAFDVFTVRPAFLLADPADRKTLGRFLHDYLALVHALDGDPCGDSADGRWLPSLNNRYRDRDLLALDRALKALFDPSDILSPGLKHAVDPQTVLRHLRSDYGAGTAEWH